MRLLVSLVTVLPLALCAPALRAQTVTYSLEGEITSVPPCVEEVFSEGDRWTLEQIIDLPLPEDDIRMSAGDDTTTPGVVVESDGAEAAPAGPEATGANDATDRDTGPASAAALTATERYPARAFSWTVGDVSGTATGVTRIFVSNDHLEQDSITWQALDYSATFRPSGLGGTGIRGIQAGLTDASGSVFETLNLPTELERNWFAGEGFFQALFQTPCGYFRQYTPLTGSVSSVRVGRDPPALR